MDTQDSNAMFDELVDRWCDGNNKYEEGLLNIDDKMWPEKRVGFLEIIPMSAKHSQKTIHYVKDRIRTHLDNIEDEKTKYNEGIQIVSDELDFLIADTGPKIA